MTNFAEAIHYLRESRLLCDWPVLIEIMEMMADKNPSHWKLPFVVCQALGGTQDQALPAMASMAALHTTIIMVDDLLDSDQRFESLGYSNGEVANFAVALQAIGLESISRSGYDQTNQILIMNRLNEMLASTSLGQHWDTHSYSLDESTYWHIAQAKSSPFFGAAFFAGALAGDASLKTAEALYDIGVIYGILVQIHDDIKDSLEVPAAADWKKGNSLPILFASKVNHPQKEQFLILQTKIDDPQIVKEAQKILFSCGAISYCTHQAIHHYEKASAMTKKIDLINQTSIINLLDEINSPIHHLLNTEPNIKSPNNQLQSTG
jgi:geranylgeranyl pyrophosphate synthase